MTWIDILLLASLTLFVTAWWWRDAPGRPQVLAVTAAVALMLGVAGGLDDRWQNLVGGGVGGLFLLALGVNRLRKAPTKAGLPWVSGALATLLAGLAGAAIWLFPVWPLPTPSGPHPVGVRSFEVRDANRPGVFLAKANEPRRLLVRVWYPAGDTAGLKQAAYFSPDEARHTAKGPGALIGFPALFTYVKHVRTNGWTDAPLLKTPGKLPVIFYSHGYTSFLTQNTALMEHLASHGYVVFSIQHTYDSTATVFPNGDVAPQDPALLQGTPPETTDESAARDKAVGGTTLNARLEGYVRLRELTLASGKSRLMRSGFVWAADRIFLHDALQRGEVPPPIRAIAEASDLSRVGQTGMSFGGATSGTVCMVDRRCAAGVNLDGGDFPFQAFATDMPVPFLMFHSDLKLIAESVGAPANAPVRSFNAFSYEAPERAGLRRDVYRVQLLGSRHLGLSDFSLFIRRPLRDPIFGSSPTPVMIGAQNDFVLGFMDRHLRGRANGFPETQMKTYAEQVTPVRVDEVRTWWLAKPEAERAALSDRIARARAAHPSP